MSVSPVFASVNKAKAELKLPESNKRHLGIKELIFVRVNVIGMTGTTDFSQTLNLLSKIAYGGGVIQHISPLNLTLKSLC